MKKKILIPAMTIAILLFAIVLCVCIFGKNKGTLGDESVQNGTATEEPVAEQSEKQESEQSSEPMAEQSSESASEQTEEPMSEQPSELASEQISEQESDSVPELNLNSELQVTDNPRIGEILNVSGVYTDSVDNTCHYAYQIPQFFADTESAKKMNQRIVDEILPEIEAEFSAMKHGGSLWIGCIWYEVFEYGDMVSLLVTIPYPNDVRFYYAYTYDFANGKEVTNLELLAMRQMTGESFVETAHEMEEAYWDKSWEFNPELKSIAELEESKALTTPELPMYLDADGTLNVFIPFPSVAGASWYYHLCEF